MTNKYRDHAALMAMQGMLAGKACEEMHGVIDNENLVSCAYDIADAMLAERTKRYGVDSNIEDTKKLVSSKTQNAVHNDWLPWNGGECPVSPDTYIEYEIRQGSKFTRYAGQLEWRENQADADFDIIRYRVVSPPAPQGDE